MASDGEYLRSIIKGAPCSARQLAQAAGLSPTLLTLIQQGERSLTPETREALARALRKWGDTCHSLADDLDPEAGGTDG